MAKQPIYMYTYVYRMGPVGAAKGEMSQEERLTFESLNLEFECTANKK